jgi:uncharacterized repeat protein (TIGR02543 family)
MVMLLILANLAQRKVVLDKIKNDVKENLNQGGVVASSNMIVTFDPTIGQINQTSKQVTYNEPYGELPTPTREGYKFIGWTSKNLAPEINESNYTSDHFNNRTTTEFRNENGTNYIRINGNPSNENIDTMWRIYPVNNKALYQGNYILSFDIRSQNSPLTQNIMKKIDRNSGKTGIYINDATKIDNMISTIENDYNFDNDGQWHHFTSLVTIPYDISNALIVIGNDIPNLYGPNSYIDIKNIQLEPGNTATEYEPYFGNITSDTIVTRGENHTLYAMWEPLYMVTFDPNGGTLSETTKWVEYNEPYGSLPTPTREGYTFLGWNGKNLFDYEKSTIYTGATEKLIIDDEQAFKRKQSYNNPTMPNIWPNFYTQDIINYEEGKKYTISFNTWSDSTVNFHKTTLYINASTSTKHNLTTITPTKQRLIGTITYHDAASSSLHIYPVVTANNNYYISNVQIEEGSIATEYEPYYITSETTVVQENNHTLKAIWKANE